MLPKKGDKVRFTEEFKQDFKQLYGDELSKYEVLNVIDVCVCKERPHLYSVFLDPKQFQWVEDGILQPPLNKIVLDEDGYVDYSNQVVFEIITCNQKLNLYCTCANPQLAQSGFGSLTFQVCRLCKKERL